MAAATKYVLAQYGTFGLAMFNADDFRLADGSTRLVCAVVGIEKGRHTDPRFQRAFRLVNTDRGQFRVFSDRSAVEVK